MKNDPSIDPCKQDQPAVEAVRLWVAASQSVPERGQLILACCYLGKINSVFVVRLEGICHAFLNRCVHMPFRLDCEQKTIVDPVANRIKCSMHGIVCDPISGASLSPTMCTGEKLTRIGLVENEQGIWLEDISVAPFSGAVN